MYGQHIHGHMKHALFILLCMGALCTGNRGSPWRRRRPCGGWRKAWPRRLRMKTGGGWEVRCHLLKADVGQRGSICCKILMRGGGLWNDEGSGGKHEAGGGSERRYQRHMLHVYVRLEAFDVTCHLGAAVGSKLKHIMCYVTMMTNMKLNMEADRLPVGS